MIRYNMVYLHASIYTSHCALMLKTKKRKITKKTKNNTLTRNGNGKNPGSKKSFKNLCVTGNVLHRRQQFSQFSQLYMYTATYLTTTTTTTHI